MARLLRNGGGWIGAIFILCGLALMGSTNDLSLGIEWVVISLFSGSLYLIGHVRASHEGRSTSAPNILRTILGTILNLGQAMGAVLLMLGFEVGLTIAATSMMLQFGVLISGAWLLLVGICRDRPARRT